MTENTETLTDGSAGLFRPWSPEVTNVQEQKEEEATVTRAVKPTPAFEEHVILPSGLHEDAQLNLISVPLAEVDKAYGQNETFIILNRSKRIFRFSSSNALRFLNPISPIRRTAVSIATHPAFAFFIIAVVLANSFALLAGIHSIGKVPLEPIFLAIYAIEFLIKVIARGLVNHKFAYLRDPWNCLDLVILIAGIWSAIGGCGVKCIPLLGEIRILKIGSNAFGLRKCINQIVASLIGLHSICLIVVYAVCLIGIIGLHFYKGALTQACVRDPVGVVKNPESLTHELWHSLAFDKNRVYHMLNGDIQRCGNLSDAGTCPSGFVCLQGVAKNPNDGFTNFDTMGWSILATIRLMLRDFWEDLLYNVVKTNGIAAPLIGVLLYSYLVLSWIWAQLAVGYLTGIKRNVPRPDHDVEQEKDTGKPANDELVAVPTENRWQRIQKQLRTLLEHRFFTIFIVAVIILNTIFLAADRHDQSYDESRILRFGNYVFLAIYIIEAGLKITAFGPTTYFRNNWNRFDFIIVILGILELGFEGVQGLSVLRSTQLLRPLRLARVWTTFNSLLTRIGNLVCIDRIRNRVIVLCIITYAFVVFGTKFFGRLYVDNVHRLETNEIPRWSFIDIQHSFMVVFRALCGEWIETMWDCMLVGDATCIAYFLLLVGVGNFLVIHLFLDLLTSDSDAEALIPPQAVVVTVVEAKTPESAETQLVKDDVEAGSIDGAVTLPLGIEEPSASTHQTPKCFPERCYGVLPLFICCDEQTQLKNTRTKLLQCLEGINYPIFVLIVIVVATVKLFAVDLKDRLAISPAIHFVELAFILVMLVDAVLKLIANGFKSYFTNIRHLIDLVNLVAAILTFVLDLQCCFWTLALRPLSIVTRCDPIVAVILAIVPQLIALLPVLIVSAFLWIIFAIIGVQMFAGRFFKCVDNEGTLLNIQTINNSSACIAQNYTLTNSAVNFDNVPSALFSLLEVATFKGWIELIQNAVDSREIGKQPIREVNIYTFWYFVAFIVCGVFCVLNMIIGVIVAHINRTGRIAENFMSRGQIATVELARSKPQAKPLVEAPTNLSPLRSKIHSLVTSTVFDLVAAAVLVCNCLVFSLYHFNASADFENILHILDGVFILLLAVEIALRAIGLTSQFITSRWNIFDLFVLIFCAARWCAHGQSPAVLMFAGVCLRILRLGRYEKYALSYWPAMTITTKASLSVTHACVNLILAVIALEVIYAILGTRIFGNIKQTAALNDVVNFNTFGRSMLLLTQIGTGAGWDGIAQAITNEQDCYASETLTNCGSNIWGSLYIVSYLAIFSILLLNFILINVLSYLSHSELKSDHGLNADEIEDVNKVWANYDSESTRFIPKDKLSHFLDDLTLDSIHKPKPNEDAIKCLGIPENDSHLLAYEDVVNALVVWKVK